MDRAKTEGRRVDSYPEEGICDMDQGDTGPTRHPQQFLTAQLWLVAVRAFPSVMPIRFFQDFTQTAGGLTPVVSAHQYQLLLYALHHVEGATT